MQINITARHLKLTSAISDYVQKKLEKANRYFNHLIWAQVILEVEKERHCAEIVIHATGRTFRAKDESTDLYAAIDLASDKIDAQLKRYKDRLKIHRVPHGGSDLVKKWSGDIEEIADMVRLPDHRVTHRKTLRLMPMAENEAIAAMEQSDSAHWIFINKGNRRVTVIYRKPDKTYGIVETMA